MSVCDWGESLFCVCVCVCVCGVCVVCVCVCGVCVRVCVRMLLTPAALSQDSKL